MEAARQQFRNYQELMDLKARESPSKSPSKLSPSQRDILIWHKLEESLDTVSTALVEAHHTQAATLSVLEHDAFTKQHDERALRFKARTCLSSLQNLHSAAHALEGNAAAAHRAHAEAEARWMSSSTEAEVSASAASTALRQTLLAELRNAEIELVQQRDKYSKRMAAALEKEQLAHEAYTSRLVDQLNGMHAAHEAQVPTWYLHGYI